MNEIELKRNAIVVPNLEAIATRGGDLEARVAALAIVDDASLIAAGELLKAIKEARKAIEADFAESKKAANALHKAITAQENKYDAPWATADGKVRAAISKYTDEQAAIRRKEEARLAEEARKRREEEALQSAIKLEAEGKAEQAAAVLDKPIVAAPVALAKPVNAAGVTMVTVKRFRVLDVTKAKPEFLVLNEKAVAELVKAVGKRAEEIVGVGCIEFYETQEPRVR